MPLQFDTTYYLQENPDVLAAILAGQIESAEAHFNQFGVFEGRNPNAIFNTFEYLAANPDVLAAGVNGFEHYLTLGAFEGRAPSDSFLPFAQFDFQTYLDANPDLAEAGIDTALEAYGHFVLFGQFEDRPGAPDTGLDGGQTFTLTDGSDIIQGQPGNLIGSKGTVDNSGDDIILASENSTGGNVTNTLGSGDNINGGLGFDELKIIDSQNVNLVPTIESVERVSVQALGVGPTTVNMINAVGTTEVVNFRSTDDVAFTAVQNDVEIILDNTTTDMSVAFAANVITDGAIDITAINSNADDVLIDVNGSSVTTLNVVSTGVVAPVEENFFDIEIDGNNDVLTTLNISGDSDVHIHQTDNTLDDLTTVNVTNTGFTNLHDLVSNNQDVTVVAADGGIEIELGDGDNTITSGAGDDFVLVGIGDSTISTGAGDDVVDVTQGGNQAITLGAGDDEVYFDDELTVDDAAEGGEGIDLISLEVNSAGTITADGDVDAVVNGFEVLELTGTIGDGITTAAVTVDLDNLDDISNVILENNTTAGTAVAETQFLDFGSNSSAFPATITIEGVEIEIAPGLNSFQIADFVAANFSAQIIAAYNANNPGAVMTSVVSRTGAPDFDDRIDFTFTQESGDAPTVDVVPNTGPLSAGATFGGTVTSVPGTTPVDEVQTLSINTAPASNGIVTINFDNDVDGNVPLVVTLVGGETTIETAARISTAINNASLTGVSATVVGSVITLTYDAVALPGAANVDQVTFTDTGTTGAVAVAATTTGGTDFALEEQTVLITAGTDVDGGYVRIALGAESLDIEVPAGLSVDELGVFITGKALDIIGVIPEVATVDYDTATNTLTFGYTAEAGNVAPIVVSNTPGSFTNVSDFQGDIVSGVDGSLDSSLTINNMATGGFITLSGDNDGQTTVNLIADTAADLLNVAIDQNDVGSGEFTFTGVETLAFTTSQDDQVLLDVDGADATTITVTGSGGIAFQQDFAELTSFDASGLAAANSATVTNDVSVTTVTADDATFTGGGGDDFLQTGAGDDTISGGLGDDTLIGNFGVDTIGGGEGDDSITGGDGADALTGGAGDDVFVYEASTDSFGANFDTITDFITGTDTIDLSAVAIDAGLFGVNYVGETNSLASANSALFQAGPTGALRVVFDTSSSQLYADVNDNGSIDGGDMIIELTGVTVLDQADFI